MTEPYEPPAIAERVPVGDPLIVGYTLSPKWRPDAQQTDSTDKRREG
jgi:hypothetical protein